MKKIYYLQKHEVKLGDMIEYNGIKTLVTEELIELNPKLFKIEDDTEPMYFRCLENGIDFTKDRIYIQNNYSTYPTRLILRADDNILYSIPDWNKSSLYKRYNLFELTTKEEWDKQELLDRAKRDYPVGTVFKGKYGIQKVIRNKPFEGRAGTIQINTDLFPGGGTIYTPEDGWAEILPLKFAAEDALAYIEKTLEDYENMLLTINIDSINARETCWFYRTLKGKEPKLYYTKILQLIADDLNDGRYIHTRRNASYHLNNADEVNIHYGGDEGCVYFKSKELAEKARDILGDKVKYLFK